jgi:hypothetical protein
MIETFLFSIMSRLAGVHSASLTGHQRLSPHRSKQLVHDASSFRAKVTNVCSYYLHPPPPLLWHTQGGLCLTQRHTRHTSTSVSDCSRMEEHSVCTHPPPSTPQKKKLPDCIGKPIEIYHSANAKTGHHLVWYLTIL